MARTYLPNPDFASDCSPPSFPWVAEEALQMAKDFHWEYADRRSLQEMCPGVFVGPLSAARDREALDRFGIKTLVAVRTQATLKIFKARFPDVYRYESMDIVEGSLLSMLPRVKPFVDTCLARGERILFYDETGNAKAAIVVCAYLMETRAITAQAAYALVKSKRLSIALDEHERYQLGEFETLLRARNTIVAHPYSVHELNRTSRRRKYSEDEDIGNGEGHGNNEHATRMDDGGELGHRRSNPFLDVDSVGSTEHDHSMAD